MVIAEDESNEGELLKLGTIRVTDEQLTKLRGMVNAGYALTSDAVGFRVLDLEFHQTLMALAGNPFLERIALSLYSLGIEYRRVASETEGVIARSAREHEIIVEAIATGDPEKAADAMRAHLTSIAKSTFEAMAKLQDSQA